MGLSRRWWGTTILYALTLVVLGACSGNIVDRLMPDSRSVSGPLTQAAADGKEIKGDVHAASTQVGSSAQQIVADGNDGQSKTAPTGPKPDGYLFTLFNRIVANGSVLLNQSSKLTEIEGKVQALNDKVEAGSKAFDQYKVDTQKVLDVKDAKIASVERENSELKSTFMRWIHGLMLAITLLFAANIAICFWIQDFKIAVVVAIGCVVALVSLVVMGRVYQITDQHADQIIWGLGIAIGCCLLYFVIETLARGSIGAAIKSNPLKDIEDAVAAVSNNAVKK